MATHQIVSRVEQEGFACRALGELAAVYAESLGEESELGGRFREAADELLAGAAARLGEEQPPLNVVPLDRKGAS